MAKVSVTYFNVKGLGEGIRLLLAYAGQEFEDIRVEKEDWAEMKPKTPFGQLPILEMGGKRYAQTLAVCRYLGRKYGLDGVDTEEDFLIDQNIAFYMDIRTKAAAAFYEQDEAIKKTKQEYLMKYQYPFLLERLERVLETNGGHMAAGKLTWADFVFAGIHDTMKIIMVMPDLDTQYPCLKKLRDTVYSLPKVKEYCDSAPKPEY